MKNIYVCALALLALMILSSDESRGQGVVTTPLSYISTIAPAAASITVDQAVEDALHDNPEIRAAVRRLTLAQRKSTTARSLDDPMLMVRDWDTPITKPWDLNQAQLMISLQQTFPNKQKRDLRGKLSEDDAQIASDELESLRQEVAANVRETCAALMRNADEMRLHNQQAAVLNQALSATLAEYTTGKVAQSDVLRAQMALTRLSEHLIELEEERDAARAQLNTLMGRSPDEAKEIEGSYRIAEALPSIDELKRIAIEHRPELAVLRKQIARAGDEGQLARLTMKPDLTLAGGYMLMPTGSMSRNAYMAELTMNLPWLNRARHDEEAKQSDAATEVAQSELAARTSTVFLEIRQAEIVMRSAQRRVKLYRDTLLPQAETAFKASTAAYQNNRGEFTNLIDSQNLLLDIRTAMYKALADSDSGSAQLERAIGAALPATHSTNTTTDKSNFNIERTNK
ncbi:MAG: TolC family protein [Acidobacteriaceae bacterium]|nr:TolC family protein [Acidobacteriaceae bacterium]